VSARNRDQSRRLDHWLFMPLGLGFFTALRMFLAYALSLLFTFFYGTAAARSRRWRTVLIPLLDILRSVPVLGSWPSRSRSSWACSLTRH